MSVSKDRLYRALDVGMYIFVDDEYSFNDDKAHVLLDFARMNPYDRASLLEEIPKDTTGKATLIAFANRVDSWINEIDWKKAPLDDLKRSIADRPEIIELYDAVPSDLWDTDEKQAVFMRYGIGAVAPEIMQPLFREIIRTQNQYASTRVYTNYVADTRNKIEQDLEKCGKTIGGGAVLILDNKVCDERLAGQMVADLKNPEMRKHCAVYATIFSTASENGHGESSKECDLYIGYTKKSEKLDGVHRSIAHAAINLLIQKYKNKHIETLTESCNVLAQNPDLVEYLYGMAKAEGEPGYEVLQQWIALMSGEKVEDSQELVELMKLSACVDAYEAKHIWDPAVPQELISAAYSEHFSPNINKYCTATAPGDVFCYDNQMYVLVGQDCDYMMGVTRPRKAPICELVPAELISPQKYNKLDNDHKFVYVNNFRDSDGHTGILKIDYTKREVICNEIINLCAFSQDGHCKIDLEGELSQTVSQLVQPFMLDYYKNLKEYFSYFPKIGEEFTGFFEAMEHLKTIEPLICVHKYTQNGTVLDYGIQRVSRLKKEAARYLYKMFLEYRGRQPYVSINLTGYECFSVCFVCGEKLYSIPAYIKLTNNRNKNKNSHIKKLSWVVYRTDLQEAIKAVLGDDYILNVQSECVELKGKETLTLELNKGSIELMKRVETDQLFVDLSFTNGETSSENEQSASFAKPY